MEVLFKKVRGYATNAGHNVRNPFSVNSKFVVFNDEMNRNAETGEIEDDRICLYDLFVTANGEDPEVEKARKNANKILASEEVELAGLVQTVFAIGVRQPIEVVKTDNGYGLVDGARRFVASMFAHWLGSSVVNEPKIIAFEKTGDDVDADTSAIVQNLQRKPVDMVELGKIVVRYRKEKKMKDLQIAMELGLVSVGKGGKRTPDRQKVRNAGLLWHSKVSDKDRERVQKGEIGWSKLLRARELIKEGEGDKRKKATQTPDKPQVTVEGTETPVVEKEVEIRLSRKVSKPFKEIMPIANDRDQVADLVKKLPAGVKNPVDIYRAALLFACGQEFSPFPKKEAEKQEPASVASDSVPVEDLAPEVIPTDSPLGSFRNK